MALNDSHLIRKTLKDASTCDICKERMKDPRNLPCGHSFCKICIASWYKESQGPEANYESRCPNCRKAFELDAQGVDGLPINYQLKCITENCQSMASSIDDTEHCAECKVQSEEIQICVDCNINLCQSCSREHLFGHCIIGQKKFEKIMTEFSDAVTCRHHHSQILEMYCKDDDVPVCNTCALLTHRNHDLISLSDHVAQKRQHLTDIESRCDNLLQEYHIEELRMKEKLDKLAKNRAAFHEYADENIKAITSMILREKLTLLEDKQKQADLSQSRILSNIEHMKANKEKTKDLLVRVKCLQRHGSSQSVAKDKTSENKWSKVVNHRRESDKGEIDIDINFSRSDFLSRCIEGMQYMLRAQKSQDGSRKHQTHKKVASTTTTETCNTPEPIDDMEEIDGPETAESNIESDEEIESGTLSPPAKRTKTEPESDEVFEEFSLTEETGVKYYHREVEQHTSYCKNGILSEADSEQRQECFESDCHSTYDRVEENESYYDAASHSGIKSLGVRPEILPTRSVRFPRRQTNLQEQYKDGETYLDLSESDNNTDEFYTLNEAEKGNEIGKSDYVTSSKTREKNVIGQTKLPCDNDMVDDCTYDEVDDNGMVEEDVSQLPPPIPPPRNYGSEDLQKLNKVIKKTESDELYEDFDLTEETDRRIKRSRDRPYRPPPPPPPLPDSDEENQENEYLIPQIQTTAKTMFSLNMSVTGLAITNKDEIFVALQNYQAVPVFDQRGNLKVEIKSDTIGKPWDLTVVNGNDTKWTIYFTDDGAETYGVKSIKKHKKKYIVENFTTDVKTPHGISSLFGKIYVCDVLPKQIRVYDIERRYCERIIENSFDTPWFIGITQRGYLVVTDWGDKKVHVISSEGDLLQTYRSTFPQSFSPTQTCVDKNDNLYIADQGSKEIYFISGNEIRRLQYREFDMKPIAMSFDKSGNLWVASRQGCFVKFTL